jgi:hypothetical protein
LDANALVLTEPEVPDGFKLRDSGNDPGRAHRVYGKWRFMRSGDAIWSEAAVFSSDTEAHDAWTMIVDFHKRRGDYDNVHEVSAILGEESYIHGGTMDGRPGLWAAVRIGQVLHRFNTYGVGESDSLELVRRQVAKTGSQPERPSEAADKARSALKDIADGKEQREQIPAAELLAHLEAIRQVTPSAYELYGSNAEEPLPPKPDAYADGTDLFPFAPPDFADVIDEATAKVRAFHAAYARLNEEQKRNFLLRSFHEQPEPVQQDAIAAWCEATGGLYDRATGNWERVGETPRGTRLQRFLAVSSSIAFGDAAQLGVVMPEGTKHLDFEEIQAARKRLV